MSLSASPFGKIITSVSEAVSKATNSAGASKAPVSNDIISQARLGQTINSYGAGVGSGLNGATANTAGAGTSAFSGVANTIQNTVRGGVDSLRQVAGSTSNIAADIQGALNKIGAGSLGGGVVAQISGAAGMLNNVLGLFKGAAIPAGGELFTQQGSAIRLAPGSENDWRVRITCAWEIFNSPLFKPLENTGGVVWPYLPNINVTSKASYNTPDSVHTNYPFHAYKNSMIEDIQITGEFTCENELEAAYWISATTFFKTATKMFFGQGENAGSPPIVCNLTGYGSSIFDKIPVIITSFSVDLKDDVNYIRCNTWGTNTWVPVISNISVTCKPIYNRTKLRQFNLQQYAAGKMTSSDGVGYL
jgi:hypothetical protein